MLWIALYLAELPLQLAQRAQARTAPFVIAEGPALRPVVCCANREARERGISAGMPVAAARALAGDIEVLPRDATSETHALHNLCCWAGQFTPMVVSQQDAHDGAGLLLEVESTLRLHGGLARLLVDVRQGIATLGYRAVVGVAPTPRAAWLLARARHVGCKVRMCLDTADVPERLAPVPLALLDWPDDTTSALCALGITTIGQGLQLPRDGFIRRFGAARRRELNQVLGLAADPRPAFVPPDRFASHIDFGFEVNDVMTLLFPLRRLLGELEGFLRGRGAGVQQWQLVLDHMSHRRTTLVVGTATSERDTGRFLALAREHLARTGHASAGAKPAHTSAGGPVLGLGIVADTLCPFEESNRSLIPDPHRPAIGWSQLVDKLGARLGNDKVHRLRTVDDHRPELAWAHDDGNRKTGSTLPSPSSPRPLWLLAAPRHLSSRDGLPLHRGPLRFVAGPERIETGWWDGIDAHRDYYVARNPRGETVWIYREHCRDAPWYLHGVFG